MSDLLLVALFLSPCLMAVMLLTGACIWLYFRLCDLQSNRAADLVAQKASEDMLISRIEELTLLHEQLVTSVRSGQHAEPETVKLFRTGTDFRKFMEQNVVEQ